MKHKITYSDAEIIAGIKAGGRDRESVTRFIFHQYAGYVYKGQHKFGVSKEEAIEAFGDALISVERHIIQGTFSTEGKLGGYLFRAFSNKCIDIVRKNSSIKVTWVEEIPEMATHAKNILTQLILNEKLTELEHLMDELGEVCKKILMDAEYYGYSIEEIASRIGFKNGPSVSSKKYRCMEQLRKLIESSSKDSESSAKDSISAH